MLRAAAVSPTSVAGTPALAQVATAFLETLVPALRKAEASDAGNVVVLACARTPR